MTELFNSWKPLTIFTRSGISDVQWSSESFSKAFFTYARGLKLYYKSISFLDSDQIVRNWLLSFEIPATIFQNTFLMAASAFLKF